MTVCDLKRGASAIVLKVDLPDPLRERLRSLGVYTGAKIVLLRVSFFKKSYLLQAGNGKVALGRDVAAGVRIWRTL